MLLKKEIEWCNSDINKIKNNISDSESQWFIKGLEQSINLINQIEEQANIDKYLLLKWVEKLIYEIINTTPKKLMFNPEAKAFIEGGLWMLEELTKQIKDSKFD